MVFKPTRPDLTNFALTDFKSRKYLTSVLTDDEIRNPKEDYVEQLRIDLGFFFRQRYVEYVAFLQNTFERFRIINKPSSSTFIVQEVAEVLLILLVYHNCAKLIVETIIFYQVLTIILDI